MGIEYSLRFDAPDAETVADLLRRLPGATESASPYAAPGLCFDFGVGPAEDGWPEATIQIEPGGAYFCDHCGGGGPAFLDRVVASLVSYFGAVTVEEL